MSPEPAIVRTVRIDYPDLHAIADVGNLCVDGNNESEDDYDDFVSPVHLRRALPENRSYGTYTTYLPRNSVLQRTMFQVTVMVIVPPLRSTVSVCLTSRLKARIRPVGNSKAIAEIRLWLVRVEARA